MRNYIKKYGTYFFRFICKQHATNSPKPLISKTKLACNEIGVFFILLGKQKSKKKTEKQGKWLKFEKGSDNFEIITDLSVLASKRQPSLRA